MDDNKTEIEAVKPVSSTDLTNLDSKVENSVEVSNFLYVRSLILYFDMYSVGFLHYVFTRLSLMMLYSFQMGDSNFSSLFYVLKTYFHKLLI